MKAHLTGTLRIVTGRGEGEVLLDEENRRRSVLQRDVDAEQIQRQRGLRFEVPLDAHSGLRRYENSHGAQGQGGVQDRPACHLRLTGVDQIVTVIGGRKVPASPRLCRKKRES
jgi:hypothetical protein